MRLAKNRSTIEAKAQSTALLTIDDAIELVVEPRSRNVGYKMPDFHTKAIYRAVKGESIGEVIPSRHSGYYYVVVANATGESFGWTGQPIDGGYLRQCDFAQHLDMMGAPPLADWGPVEESVLASVFTEEDYFPFGKSDLIQEAQSD